jgi:hypothetical protein
MTAPAYIGQTQLTAIVHAADGVRFVATGQCAAHLSAQVVSYIRSRCESVLWPSVAREVLALINDDKPHAAMAMYFANVGERWDPERLELGGLSFGQ